MLKKSFIFIIFFYLYLIPATNELYTIGAADVLEVFIWQNETIGRTLPVRPDGRISLPLVGDIQAAGLTTEELDNAITEKLIPYIKAPEVSVMILEFNSKKVSIIGEVKRPGMYSLTHSANIIEIISLAGGYTENAMRKKVKILKKNKDKTMIITINENTIDFILQNGDVIIVPKNTYARIKFVEKYIVLPVLYGIVQYIIYGFIN